MIALDLQRLVTGAPVYVNGVPFTDSHCLYYEVRKLSLIGGCLHIRTGKYPDEQLTTPAISVGHVLDALSESTEYILRLKFESRTPLSLCPAITELADVMGLYRSFAVHRITVDGDALKIEVEVSV